jgi:hypothetical protein
VLPRDRPQVSVADGGDAKTARDINDAPAFAPAGQRQGERDDPAVLGPHAGHVKLDRSHMTTAPAT